MLDYKFRPFHDEGQCLSQMPRDLSTSSKFLMKCKSYDLGIGFSEVKMAVAY